MDGYGSSRVGRTGGAWSFAVRDGITQQRCWLSYASPTFVAAPGRWAEGQLDGGQRESGPSERPTALAAKHALVPSVPVRAGQRLGAAGFEGTSPRLPSTHPDRIAFR